MHIKIVLLTLAVGFITTVLGQNCGIVGETNTIIQVEKVNETTPAQYLIWTAATYNVTSAVPVTSPITKYITGWRYTTKYEFLTSAVFPEFLNTERALEIERNVIFTCEDEKQITFTFIIPVEDLNTEKPTFDKPEYNLTISLANITAEEPINPGIIVSDLDVHIKNANVFIRSSNRYVMRFVTPLWAGEEIPDAYEYQVEFFLNMDYIEVGEYSIILTADDGKFSTFSNLNLNITP